jgi:hypothetical protein
MNRVQNSANTIPSSLPSLFRGVYSRVARKLKIDPSYVSRVARGERNSEEIARALDIELRRISVLASRNGNADGHANGHGAVHNKRRKRSQAK